ncbi:GroES-like protein [Cylindrobasidium torrendii FP15055 ss-10]|uniref:GroES-like protein n=1 Tax=Cylindrobasidium torrendii FP15055 ss-10 TaxID=1314674 RepID=A0A0D7BLY7_9AGAR|nr:GroES-like protein [Cylindrobasidium torrendii FP15055 ss-10]
MNRLPEYIQALVNTNDNGFPGAEVRTIPFSRTFKVARLPKDHIVVKAKAFGLNPLDWKLTIGPFAAKSGTGKVVGHDMAGEVVVVGANVSNFKVGDRVASSQFGTWYQDNGAYADYSVLDSALAFKLPDDVTFEAGASLPVGLYTAVQAIHGRLAISLPSSKEKISQEKVMLIWSAATAVGHGAIQLATNAGIRVIAVASSRNHADLIALGAIACFEYTDPDVVAKVTAAAGRRFDFGIDCVGKGNSSDLTVSAISHGGHLISIMLASDTALSLAKEKNIKVDYILGGTLHGFEFELVGNTIPVVPEDHALIKKWTSTEMPFLFKHGLLKHPKLRIMPGGIQGIVKGMEIMRDGAYVAEKLIYPV